MNAIAIAKAKERTSQIRASVFPDIDQDQIWDVKNKKKTKGYVSIPRSFALIGQIMDKLSGNGKPVSNCFLELWCRSNEEGFLNLSKPYETALASGFAGERGVSTWKERVRRLETLGFIKTAAGTSGDLHYVQILNPYHIIKSHAAAKTPGFSMKHYHALMERVIEIKATDME